MLPTVYLARLDEMEDLFNRSVHICNDDVLVGIGDMCCARFSCDERFVVRLSVA